MKKIIFAFAFVYILCSCGKDQDLPSNLPGKWTDDNQEISFFQNNEYGVKYLRIGGGKDTVLTDSVWGNYYLDKKRNNLSYYQKGYKQKSGLVVYKDLNAGTWNVQFLTDSTLRYESSTTVGFLRRLQN